MPEASSFAATPEQLELALAALREITPADSVGEVLGSRLEETGTLTLRFSNNLPGYPGWQWNVSLALLEGSDPTVLEAELLPDDGALLAPDWIPWSVRLAEFLESQKQAAESGLALEEDVPEGIRELTDDDLTDAELADVVDEFDPEDDESDESLDDLDGEDDEDLDEDEDADDPDLDDEDDDEDSDDYLGVRDNVHSGDIDGVELDEDAFNQPWEESEEESDEDESEDDDEDSDEDESEDDEV